MTGQFSGFGLGLRKPHYDMFVSGEAAVDFAEVISENFMVEGGRPLSILRAVRSNYPVALHGVSMSLASADGLDIDYLSQLKRLADAIEPLFVSDHLSWSSIGGLATHDLLPFPYTSEALDIACANVAFAQDFLQREILVENPSAYVDFACSTMTEGEFMSELCRRTGCGMLLDVNNVFVTAANRGMDPLACIEAFPLASVRQLHLAGHSEGRELLIDTHDQPICGGVWSLYASVLPSLGPVATMIERDDHIPPLRELLGELTTARIIASVLGRPSA
jgi:uncharacterized protein (UPF0276 family)